MSGDVTVGYLQRLSFMPRKDNNGSTLIAGQEYDDVYFLGGELYNVILTDVTINGVSTARTETIVTAAGDYNADVTDYIITIDKTVPEVTTVFLPAAPQLSKSYIIKDGAGNAGSFAITVDGNGNNIDSASTYVISVGWGAIEIVFNGTEWNILNTYRDSSSQSLITPGVTTDNAVVLWNGMTGSAVKNSAVTIDAFGNILTPGFIQVDFVSSDSDVTAGGDITATGQIAASNFSGSSSGTNTGDQTTSGTLDRITVTNGGTNPVIDISANYAGQNTIVTLGTVTTGVWNGTTIAVANGGTGATTAANARTNLGLAIGTDVQAFDAGLQSIAGLTTAANNGIYTTALDTYAIYSLTAGGRALGGVAGTANTFPYFSAANTVTLGSITAAGLNLLDDADAAAQRTTLGATTVGNAVFTAADQAAAQAAIGVTPAVSQSTTVTLTGANTNLSLTIPPNVVSILVRLSGVTNGSGGVVGLQIGNSGVFATTGYLGGTSAGGANGSYFSVGGLSQQFGNGVATLAKAPGSNLWSCSSTMGSSANCLAQGGSLSLASPLDRVRLINASGSFTAGTADITFITA